jgi:hypothetical protein
MQTLNIYSVKFDNDQSFADHDHFTVVVLAISEQNAKEEAYKTLDSHTIKWYPSVDVRLEFTGIKVE